jgi:hypothetical protein
MLPFLHAMVGRGARPPFTAAASASSLSATGANGSTETTTSTTVTPTGLGTFTYAWTRISGSTSINVTSSTSATTTFSGVAPSNSTINATFRCTVTRDDGQTAYADVAVDLTAMTVFSTNIAPNNITPAGAPLSNHTVTLTAGPSGGSGSYSYAWSITSSNWTCSISGSSTGSSCTFNYQMGPDDTHGYSTTISLTVHDTVTGGNANANATIYQFDVNW